MTASVLVDLISKWIIESGSFTYTYPIDEEIGVDPNCPLEIESFSAPECGSGKLCLINHSYSLVDSFYWYDTNAVIEEVQAVVLHKLINTHVFSLQRHPPSFSIVVLSKKEFLQSSWYAILGLQT